jgi:hypothetical protein
MELKGNDIIVSKDVLKLFKNSVRVIDDWHLQGIIAIDPSMLIKLQKVLPEMFGKNILEKYSISIAYKGKDIKKDFHKAGFAFNEERLIDKIYLAGIPVSWQLLKKAGIDHKKFDVLLSPKNMR